MRGYVRGDDFQTGIGRGSGRSGRYPRGVSHGVGGKVGIRVGRYLISLTIYEF